MEDKRRLAAQIMAHDPRHPRVLVVVGVAPFWTAGRHTFIDDILQRAGGVNAASALNGYGPYSTEIILAHPPDLILASPADQSALRADPVFGGLSAVRQGRFFSVTPDTLDRPGPRLADALLQVAHALHPGVK
jgi:iron complex transport system substrate-binding protein